MSVNAGESFVNAHMQRKFVHLVLDNAAGTVTVDATNTEPNLIGKVEVKTSAVVGTVVTEYTWTAPNGTTIFGIGLLDGLAKGPISGFAFFLDNTKASGVVGAVVAQDSATAPAGITTSSNVAVRLTFTSTMAALTGKIHVFLEYAI